MSDAEVKAKCKQLFGQWAVTYKKTAGMERVAALYMQLPQRKKPVQQRQSKVLRETEAETDDGRMGHSVTVSAGGGPAKSLRSTPDSSSSASRPSALSSSSSFTGAKSKFSRDKKSKMKPFNLEKEKPQLLQTLASTSVASTNLINALKLTNRENMRVSENPEVMQRFEACKVLRRQILRYIQHVESEQYLGSLIHANEELVNALMTFEVLDKSVEDDSDSEDEWNGDDSSPRKGSREKDTTEAFAGLSFDHRKTSPSQRRLVSNGKGRLEDSEESSAEDEEEGEEEDENDPFADRNAVHEPKAERPGMTW